MTTKFGGKATNLQRRLYLLGACILLVGLGSAIAIYLTVEDASDIALVYDFQHSKKYRHDLEVYGGKMNLLANDFMLWFEGLWHGKSLAMTLGCITIVISFVVFVGAYFSSHVKSDPGDENHRC